MSEDDIISEIIKHEIEITQAIIKGHKPIEGDIYHDKRIRVIELREMLKNIKK
jgi:hypothetical protein